MLTIKESNKLVNLSESEMLPKPYQESIDNFLEHNLQEGHLEERELVEKSAAQNKKEFDAEKKAVRKLQEAILKKSGKMLFALKDGENEIVGAIMTNCPAEKVKTLWYKYYNAEFDEKDTVPKKKNWEEDLGADIFCQFLNELGYAAVQVHGTNVDCF